MKFNSKTLYAALLVAVVGGAAAYWHYSPYLAIHGMQSAAQEGDAQAFNGYVDYPKLRESIKGQFTVALATSVEQSKAQPGMAALGSAMAMAMINPMVEAMVRPEVVMAAMTRSNLELNPTEGSPGAASTQSRDVSFRNEPKWASARDGFNRFVVYPVKEGETVDERVSAVFVRSGFADWKLSELQMPRLN